jgi:hypothetical protein
VAGGRFWSVLPDNRKPLRSVKRSVGEVSSAAWPMATLDDAAITQRICWLCRSHISTRKRRLVGIDSRAVILSHCKHSPPQFPQAAYKRINFFSTSQTSPASYARGALSSKKKPRRSGAESKEISQPTKLLGFLATLAATLLSALSGLRRLLAGLLVWILLAALAALLATLATLTALLVAWILLSHVFLLEIVEIHNNG